VQESRAEMTAMAEETLSVSGILLAKVFGRERDDVRRFSVANEQLAQFQTRARVNGRLFWAVVGVFFAAAPAAVFVVAAWQLAGGGTAITAGTVVAFTTLQARLFWPVGELFWYGVEIRSSFAMSADLRVPRPRERARGRHPERWCSSQRGRAVASS
jgi:ATP-binding cassette subfamily B protein